MAANQRFPTCGSRPHVGSASFFIGVATGRQTYKKYMHNCTSTMISLVSVKNCAVKIDYIYADRNITGLQLWCLLHIFFSSMSGVAVLREKKCGVARCRRLGIDAVNGLTQLKRAMC